VKLPLSLCLSCTVLLDFSKHSLAISIGIVTLVIFEAPQPHKTRSIAESSLVHAACTRSTI